MSSDRYINYMLADDDWQPNIGDHVQENHYDGNRLVRVDRYEVLENGGHRPLPLWPGGLGFPTENTPK